MKLVVPYGIRFGADGEVETVPVVHARIQSKKGWIPGIFVVDSGATVTLLPHGDAESLGLDVRTGIRVSIRSATGHEANGYRHRVDLLIGNFLLRAVAVIFAESHAVPRILGREDIFPRFGILFDEARRRVGFLDARKKRRAIDRMLATSAGA